MDLRPASFGARPSRAFAAAIQEKSIINHLMCWRNACVCVRICFMLIGERLREIREAKNLSQGVIEKRCGLIRCYISRVENGHTVPAIETLEKFAHALEVPLYQLFYEGEAPRKLSQTARAKASEKNAWGGSGKNAILLIKFRKLLARMNKADRQLLLHTAQRMVRRS
jgi:transcriptional regulator with XRE-family HTH domain